MTEKKYNTFSNWKRVFTLFAAILVIFLLAGCATGGNYGKLHRDRDLDNMFLNYEVLPDHLYYTTGGYDAPDAILAIHIDYELEGAANIWLPIPNVDNAQMQKWIYTLAPEQSYWGEYFAAYILDPNGKRVGAWYSREAYTTVKFLEGNKIQVYAPGPGRDMDFTREYKERGF